MCSFYSSTVFYDVLYSYHCRLCSPVTGLTSQGSVISHSVAQRHHQTATVTTFEDSLDVDVVEQCGDSM